LGVLAAVTGASGQTFPCGPVPAPIPDHDTTGVTLACAVSGLATAVGSVQVTITLNPAHTYAGDLDAYLAPPSSTPGDQASFLLFDAVNGFIEDAVMAGPYTFTDLATTIFLDAAEDAEGGHVIPSGSYRTGQQNEATSLNEGLAGISIGAANGTWRLRVRDLGTPDTGTISAASVTLGPPTIVASLLPTSRSVQAPTGVASAFATIINTGTSAATNCRISRRTVIPGDFIYQTTDALNQLVGSPNMPATIAPGQAQSFFFAFTPSGPIGPVDAQLNFVCDQSAAAIISGLTTLALVASATPVPDVIALAATINNTGILDVPGNGAGAAAFAVATSNVGAAATLTVSADTGSANLPVTLSVCQTGPSGCIAGPAPSLTVPMGAGETSTFSVFAQGQGVPISFDPANNRATVRFTDGSGTRRGSTGTAIRTVP
jgi:subtilisin-like proprotein convertase family protein